MPNNLTNVVRLHDAVLKRTSARPWLDGLAVPAWLKSDIYGDHWDVTVSNANSSKLTTIRWKVMLPDRTRLNDPENSHLLKTIQLFTYWSRMDVDPLTNSGHAQETRAYTIVSFMSWARLNGYRRLADLIPEDFEAFKQDLVGGMGCVHDYERRLDAYIQDKRTKGETFPMTMRRGKNYRLNVPALCDEMGVDYECAINVAAFSNGITRLRKEENLYLTPKQREVLNRDIEDETDDTYGTLRLRLQNLAGLWHYRDKLGDNLTFDPFRHQKPATMAAAMYKQGTLAFARTGTIPIAQAAFLIDRALRWVLDYGEDLLRLRDVYEKQVIPQIEADSNKNAHKVVGEAINAEFQKRLDSFVPRHEGPGQPWPMDSSLTSASDQRQLKGLPFFKALNRFLPVACAIVVAFFSARRHEELLSIRARTGSNSYALQFDESGVWLECWIEKIVQDWDRVPVPSSVKLAVRLLRRWSYPARRLTGQPRLFQCKALGSEKIVEFDLGQCLKEFAEFIDVPPLDSGAKWVFKPHQFRRLFVIMFYWRWDLGRGDLSTLQYHLRQLDPEMTRVYSTECKPGKAYNDAHKQHDYELFVEAVSAKRNVSGQFGERFKEALARIAERCKKNIEVVTPQVMNRRIARFLMKSKKASVPLPWGYCMAERDENRTIVGALCHGGIPQGNLPRLENAGPLMCAGCPRFLASDTLRGYWEGIAAVEESVACNLNNPSMKREASKRRAFALRDAIDMLFVNSRPLEGF